MWKKGNHGCIRGVLGEATELCEQHCLQPIRIKVQQEQSSVSTMKKEEAEEESAPSSCKMCATNFAEAVKTCSLQCRGSEDTAKFFKRVWEEIAKQCLNCPPFQKMSSVLSMEAETETALPPICFFKCAAKIFQATIESAGSEDFGACVIKVLGRIAKDCIVCYMGLNL